MKRFTLLKSMLLLCALVAGSGSVWADEVWVKTDLANLHTGDVVIVVEVENGYAMKNSQPSASKGPLAVAVTLNAAKTQITAGVTNDIKYTYTETTGGFKLAVGVNFLYTTTSNNGLRIGSEATNNHNVFVTHTDGSKSYVGFKINDGSNDRYFGCYNNTDFRSYTSIGSNIPNQTIALFKKYVSVTIPTFGLASIVSSEKLDFSNDIDNLDAPFKATAAVAETGVTLTPMSGIIAASTPMILKGTAGETAYIPTTGADADPDAVTGNILAGSATEDVSVTANNAYILKGGKFCKVIANSDVPKGKAYLPAGSVSAKELTLNFEDENTTGIEKTVANKTMDGQYYNLAGQRVAQPTKGLYIVNGKKVIIK